MGAFDRQCSAQIISGISALGGLVRHNARYFTWAGAISGERCIVPSIDVFDFVEVIEKSLDGLIGG